ncbi:MAG: S8 family serine peptidase [Crocinitomicaceae bacterium]|nr:S8 family serine peptidase [Crocinitomicaceae bacterium]
MKKLIFTSLLFSLLPCMAQENFQEATYVPGEVLIQIDDPSNIVEVIESHQFIADVYTGLRVSREISKPVNIWLLSFDENAISHDQMLTSLYTNKHILIAQNNHYIQERVTVPNDPSFGSQWHHVNTNDKDIDSDLAWDVTTGGTTSNGDEIVVCVIEGSGANWAHADLVANHWVNTAEIPNNSIDDDGNGYVDDYDGWNSGNNTDNIGTGTHGTQVSGMIGAVGNNNTNVAGANWTVKIMQVDMGSLTEANVIAAYTYPLTLRQDYNASGGTDGAFVVATNASWGIDYGDPTDYPLWCDFYNTLGQAGILNCGATANLNINIDTQGDMPTACSSPYMISVTATNNNDVRTFSGYGQTTIDLGAPGENVVTTGSTGISTVSGTSFASPVTAGVIALLYSVPCSGLADLALSDPQAAADFVRDALLNGVDPVSNLTTETVTGGRLNANNSVQYVLTNCPTTCDMTSSGISTDPDCADDCNGIITVTATGGTGIYQYDIGSGPQGSNTFTGLCEGTYSVTVTDGGACTQVLDFTVTDPSAVDGSVVISPSPSGNDGSIDLTPSGGSAPYSFAWTGPSGFTSSSEDISALAPGLYNVTITDNNGCQYTLTGLDVPSCDMILNETTENVSCNGDCDGSVVINPTGGSGIFTYDIGTGAQTSNTFNSLCAGTYSVTVDDGDLCNQTVDITINEPAALGGGTAVTDELIGADGAINLTVTGGVAPYSFAWTGPSGYTASTEDITGLVGGIYHVVVTDNNGCIILISDVTVGSSVGFDEHELLFNIYPNPADKQITISYPSEQLVQFYLFDVSGRTVGTYSINKTSEINISTLAGGTYTYTIVHSDGTLLQSGHLIIE